MEFKKIDTESYESISGYLDELYYRLRELEDFYVVDNRYYVAHNDNMVGIVYDNGQRLVYNGISHNGMNAKNDLYPTFVEDNDKYNFIKDDGATIITNTNKINDNIVIYKYVEGNEEKDQLPYCGITIKNDYFPYIINFIYRAMQYNLDIGYLTSYSNYHYPHNIEYYEPKKLLGLIEYVKKTKYIKDISTEEYHKILLDLKGITLAKHSASNYDDIGPYSIQYSIPSIIEFLINDQYFDYNKSKIITKEYQKTLKRGR